MTRGNSTPSKIAGGGVPAVLAKRISDLVTWGEVVEADYDAGKFRVRIGSDEAMPDEKGGKADVLSYWLPVATGRAGANRSWVMPELGDQVVVMSPGGNIANGFIAFHVNTAGHAPHVSFDPNVQRWVFGADLDFYNDIVDDVNRTLKHRYLHVPDGGYFMVTAGHDYLPNSAVLVKPDEISLRVKDTSLVVYADRIELQVENGKTQFRLTASEIISLVENASVIRQLAGSIDMQIGTLGQIKLTAAELLTRIESAFTRLTSAEYIAELVQQQVKLALNAQGVKAQANLAAITLAQAGNVAINANGSNMVFTQSAIILKALSYDAMQEAPPPLSYTASSPAAPAAFPVIAPYAPMPRPELVPGFDPFIPPVSPTIRS